MDVAGISTGGSIAPQLAADHADGRGRRAAGAPAWLTGPRLLAGEDDLADLATTIDAEDAFDLAACRSPIRASPLLIAGSTDHFYSPELFPRQFNRREWPNIRPALTHGSPGAAMPQ